MAKKHQFSDKAVLAARIFCVVVGVLLIWGGRTIAVQFETTEAMIGGGVVAALGALVAVFGVLSARNACVALAGTILGLVFP